MKSTSLETLEFESCGYVRLPLDFNQSVLGPTGAITQTPQVTKRISDIESFMMKPNDYTLGVIVNHIEEVERSALENGFNMTIGWGTDKAEERLDAIDDGVPNAGTGRFSGLIQRRHVPSSGQT